MPQPSIRARSEAVRRGGARRVLSVLHRVPRRMDLLEYQGKQLFARHGVPVPSGQAATNVEDAVTAADEIGYPCVVKAQVQIGGRGKAGGIKIAGDEARRASTPAGDPRHGHPRPLVHELWIEGASQIASEYYASVVFDRSAKAPLVMLSPRAEWTSRRWPRGPGRDRAPPRRPAAGLPGLHGRRLAFEAGVDADVVEGVVDAMLALYEVCRSRRTPRSSRSTR